MFLVLRKKHLDSAWKRPTRMQPTKRSPKPSLKHERGPSLVHAICRHAQPSQVHGLAHACSTCNLAYSVRSMVSCGLYERIHAGIVWHVGFGRFMRGRLYGSFSMHGLRVWDAFLASFGLYFQHKLDIQIPVEEDFDTESSMGCQSLKKSDKEPKISMYENLKGFREVWLWQKKLVELRDESS